MWIGEGSPVRSIVQLKHVLILTLELQTLQQILINVLVELQLGSQPKIHHIGWTHFNNVYAFAN